MLTPAFKYLVTNLFARANVVIGKNITVHDETFYRDVILRGSLGLGESFMDGKWTSPDLMDTIKRLSKSTLLKRVKYWLSWLYPLEWLRTLLICLFGQTRASARVVGSQHYDLSTEMYEQMLGKPMQYSLSLIHIWRCRRIERCRSRWSPYH